MLQNDNNPVTDIIVNSKGTRVIRHTASIKKPSETTALHINKSIARK
jgi:hypothetical protein